MKVSNESNINKPKNNFSQINNNKDDFKSFNQEVLNEINYAREKPEEYLLKLEDIKNSLSSKNEKFLYIDNIPYIYQNLFSSLENSISFLKTQKKLSKLTNLQPLSNACQEMKKEIITAKGKKDNRNENIKFKELLNKYGNSYGDNYEIIGFNLLDPEFIVLNLILSDGDSTNLGRKIIFNPNIKYIGIDAHFGDEIFNDMFHILIFSEDFCEKTKNNQTLVNKYKNKNPNYISKTIFYKMSNTYIDQADEILLSNKINNIINSSRKYKIKKDKSSKHKTKHKNKRHLEENNYKTKNDIYYNYYTYNKNFGNNFDEDEFFEKEFENKWGKIEKDRNFHKKIFSTSTTTENGANTTIISEVFENVQNGVKKGYFTEQRKVNNYNKSWKNENAEKEKRDMAFLKDMERREKQRMKNSGKYANRNKNIEQLDENEELPEGVVDIKIKRKNIVDSDGNPAVEIIKTITYEDGSVQNIVKRQIVDNE